MKAISVKQAAAPDGDSLMVGGFMGVRSSERVIDEIVRQRKKLSP
jgi:acyl CoA:acetate/3-ketoacid CoA transferase alpha subunit